MAKQLSLIKTDFEYGGTHSLGKAKVRRPLSTTKPIHVTLRSSKAAGNFSLKRNKTALLQLLYKQAFRWHVSVYNVSINGNHIHMALRGKRLDWLRNFFRAFAGLAARLVTKAERSKPFGKFWDHTLWSRVAEWGEAFKALNGYVVRNILESEGLIPYQPRGRRTILRV